MRDRDLIEALEAMHVRAMAIIARATSERAEADWQRAVEAMRAGAAISVEPGSAQQ